MIDRCKECGANLAMVGRSHRCVHGAAQTLALARAREAKEAPAKSKGLRILSRPNSLPQPVEPLGDGIALTSIAHPPGLIEKMADAIRSGKLSLKRGRPKITEPRPWETEGVSKRTYYRRRQAKAAKGEER